MRVRIVTPSRLALAALLFTAARPALAQDVEEVVVTGQREAQRAAIAVKKEEFVVADVVSADDIGKLPDHNTAAALRRIPGVSVMEDQSEPRFPTIRGLRSTYNRTTLDGAPVTPVEDTTRTVPLDIVPSVLVSRLEVVKTVTPEMDANAIGGIIDVRTRSAFDSRSPFVNALASVGHYERHGGVRNDEPAYRLAFAAGRRFGPDENWGLVVSGSLEQLDYDIPQVESADPSVREYTAAGAPVLSGAANGNGLQVPTQVRLFWYNNTKQRSGASAKLEYRPSDGFQWVTSAVYAKMEDDEARLEYRTEPLGNVSNQTPTSGSFARGRNIIHLNQPITTREIALGRSGFTWQVQPALTADGDLVFTQGHLSQPNTSVEFRTVDAQGANYAFNYDTTNPLFPLFTPVNEANFRNPANYRLQQHRVQDQQSYERAWQGRFNLTFDDGVEERNLKLKAGGVVRLSDRKSINHRTDYTAAPGFNYTLDLVDKAGPAELIAGRYLLNPQVDPAQAVSFFEANRNSFVAAVGLPSGDYGVSEDIYAGYGEAIYKLGDLQLVGGVRYERTKVESRAYRLAGSTLTEVHNSGEYDNWLPSLHLTWNLRPDLIVRAAWTNTIGRPDYSSIAGGETLNFNGSQATLARGNPDLKPRESRGLDLSFEFYPRDGLVSLAVFSKDIKDEIFTLSDVETLDVGRGPEPVIVSTSRNAESAKIRGLEFGLQQAFTFLPAPFDGFGFNGNVTLLDSDFTFVTSTGTRKRGLFQQPDITTNESVYYQRGPVELRVSHNYIGGFLETIVDTNPNSDQWWKGRHSFDASFSWRLRPQLQLFVEGQNLTNTGRQEVTGPGGRYLQEWANYGRTYWLGLTAAF